jgi:hypothetical protein
MENDPETLKREWSNLVKCPGWDLFLELIAGQEEVRFKEILRPTESVDGALRQEFIKGELAFARTIKVLPALAIEELERIIEENSYEREK